MESQAKAIFKNNLHRICIDYLEFNPFSVKNRKKEYVWERQSAMYVLNVYKNSLNLTLGDIGFLCSGENGHTYDHATVMHSIKVVVNEARVSERHEMIQRWYSFVSMALAGRDKAYNDISSIIFKIDNNTKFTEEEKPKWALCKQLLKTTLIKSYEVIQEEH